jgi:hypothetical protein
MAYRASDRAALSSLFMASAGAGAAACLSRARFTPLFEPQAVLTRSAHDADRPYRRGEFVTIDPPR